MLVDARPEDQFRERFFHRTPMGLQQAGRRGPAQGGGKQRHPGGKQGARAKQEGPACGRSVQDQPRQQQQQELNHGQHKFQERPTPARLMVKLIKGFW
jgi:hypothetical protein